MKKAVSFIMAVFFIILCFSSIGANADDPYTSVEYYDDGIPAYDEHGEPIPNTWIITYTSSNLPCATYYFSHYFNSYNNCINIYSRLQYKPWYVESNILNKYCLKVSIDYLISYIHATSDQPVRPFYYYASLADVHHSYTKQYRSDLTVSHIYIYHYVNTEDMGDSYNSLYSSFLSTRIYIFN